MKRLVLLATTVALVSGAVVFSRSQPATSATAVTADTSDTIQIERAEKNPWTNLNLNNKSDQFQFAIVSDRTGGHREKIFSRAVEQINLLQPEFVITVGDLVEGYSNVKETIDKDWNQFEGFTKKFQMPFFYLPGNHDMATKELVEEWGGRFGKTYYHFVYKNVLFLGVNSEENKGKMTEEQVKYFEQAIAANPKVRWTLVFFHRPLWKEAPGKDATSGWERLEKALAGRKYTAFCGHVHRYEKTVRNGMNHYQLATTGGGSRLRGVKFGEFDHVVWVTMKNDGPVLANLMLDGIYPEDLRIPDTDEPGKERKLPKTYPLKGKVLLDGKPQEGATVRFYSNKKNAKKRFTLVADGVSEKDGSFVVTSFSAFDGLPAGEYIVTAIRTGEYLRQGTGETNTFPEKFASPQTSPLTVTISETGVNELTLNLTK